MQQEEKFVLALLENATRIKKLLARRKIMAKNTKIKLTNSVWRAADPLRSSMDSSEFSQYLLPLVFYKVLIG